MKTIDITEKIENFETHLKNNARTIFSAKFGDGKTYFLKEYIERHKENTVFIVLHPINYSVATNEDIFEYVKRDILVELSKHEEIKEVDWDKVAKTVFNFDSLLEEGEFVFSDASPLMKAALIPFRLFKKVDDKYAIDKFFDRFSKMQGGIYEQDPFTAAIKAAVAKIQEHNRKCVLIIEDLDRIDPAHLFRILNVLGAHIDEDINTNKYGFDNIIAVLDYHMTKHIFHHFYGKEANYKGYMSKFTSHTIFEYSVTRIAVGKLVEYLRDECELDNNAFDFMWVNEQKAGEIVTLNEMLKTLSIRDVVNVLDDIESQYMSEPVKINTYMIDPCVPLVKLLAVFVRLKMPFDTSRIAQFLHQSLKHYKLLGAFVLENLALVNRTLRFGNQYVFFEIEQKDGMASVNYVPTVNTEEEYYQEQTPFIIDMVYASVHDCQPRS